MWPFQRKAQTPAPGGPLPLPAPVIRRDWAGLPPIQRLIGDHPLTAPSDRFSGDLATHRDPSVSTDQMGHRVSAEAPPGLVLAVVRPTTRSEGPAMIPRPRVQRRVEGAVTESGEWDGDAAAPDEARPSPYPATVQRTPAMELPTVTPLPPTPALIALAPDVELAPAVTAPRRGIMTAGEPALQRQDDSAMPPTPPAARLTLGQARRMGLGAPINKVPDRSLQRSPGEPTPPPDTSSSFPLPSSSGDTMRSSNAAPVESSTPPVKTSSTMESRHLELPLAPTHSTTDAPREPILAPSDGPASRSSAMPLPISDIDTGSSARPTAAPLAVQASSVTAQSPLGLSEAPAPGPREAPLLSAAPGPGLRETAMDFGIRGARTTPVRSQPLAGTPSAPAVLSFTPLVGRRPIATFQRSAENIAPAGKHRSAAAAPDEPGDRALDFAVDDEPAREEQVSFANDLGEPSSQPSTQRLAGETAVDSPAAALTLPPTPRNAVAGSAGERPIAGEAAAGSNFPLVPTPIIIQRIASDESWRPSGWATMTAGMALQRAPAEAPAASQAPGAASARPYAVAAPDGSAVHPPADSPAAEADMDTLAAKLYDRIRARLKTELLVDRERAGFLTDLR